MPFLTDTPHPAEALTGHTKRVKLATGGLVLIRRVNIDAVTLDSVTHILNASSLLHTAAEHARAVNEEAEARSGESARTPSFSDVEQIETALEVSKRLLRASLVEPRLEELVSIYGGRDDLSDPDLGLGPDYDILMEAINTFVEPTEQEAETARRFPGKMGANAGRAGAKVRGKAVHSD